MNKIMCTIIIMTCALMIACSKTDALVDAAEEGDAIQVQQLLAEGIDANCTGREGQTPLIAASIQGNNEVISILLANGANIDATYNDGRTALIEAIAFNRPETVKILLARNADVNAATNLNQTPMSIAVTLNRTDIIPLLRAAGAAEYTPPISAQKAASPEEALRRAEESRKRFQEALDRSK